MPRKHMTLCSCCFRADNLQLLDTGTTICGSSVCVEMEQTMRQYAKCEVCNLDFLFNHLGRMGRLRNTCSDVCQVMLKSKKAKNRYNADSEYRAALLDRRQPFRQLGQLAKIAESAKKLAEL